MEEINFIHNTTSLYSTKKKFRKKKKNIKSNKIIILIILLIFLVFYICSFFVVKVFGKTNLIFFDKKISKNSRTSNKLKVCLCTIGKYENLYAKEYVNHYKKLGYQHIYIYDNNNKDEEKIEDVLKEEIKSGFVTINNVRGVHAAQCPSYIDCYERYNKLYDWLSFFDMDEFLEIKEKNIQEFLSNERYKDCINIKVNFLFYSDNELLHYDNRPLEVRFNHSLVNHRNNAFLKVTVRGGLKTNYWSITCTAHTSHMKCVSCNSAEEKLIIKQGRRELILLMQL